MTTITFDEEIKIEKTHFKNVSEFLSNYKSHFDNSNNELIWWTDKEIKEFEKYLMIKDYEQMSEEEKNIDWDKVFTKEDVEAFNWNSKENFTTLSINSSLPWINDPEEDKIWK